MRLPRVKKLRNNLLNVLICQYSIDKLEKVVGVKFNLHGTFMDCIDFLIPRCYVGVTGLPVPADLDATMRRAVGRQPVVSRCDLAEHCHALHTI